MNAKPLIYGFKNEVLESQFQVIYEYPSKVAAMLLNDEIDIGLVPVAVIPELNDAYIISDYCIGTEGEVASVCLFSEVPIHQIETILLDYQSKTSVALLKILLKKYWKITPQLIQASADYEENISGTTAGLVIGDRAFTQRLKSNYIYDLGSEWKNFTGLPFVFAVWLANKPISTLQKEAFNIATAIGLSHINEISTQLSFQEYDMKKYYTENISFILNEKKRQALELFLKNME
jgi:chorismate dehydratase